MGIDTDYNDAPDLSSVHLVFVLAENSFCCYFTWEFLVRFLALEQKRNCLKDGWFKVDAVLVTCMVLETRILPIILSGAGGGAIKAHAAIAAANHPQYTIGSTQQVELTNTAAQLPQQAGRLTSCTI